MTLRVQCDRCCEPLGDLCGACVAAVRQFVQGRSTTAPDGDTADGDGARASPHPSVQDPGEP